MPLRGANAAMLAVALLMMLNSLCRGGVRCSLMLRLVNFRCALLAAAARLCHATAAAAVLYAGILGFLFLRFTDGYSLLRTS
jgi:hypothetical protein